MTYEEMWDAFCQKDENAINADYSAWQFGDNPNELALLVKNGVKKATSSLYKLYQVDGDAIPFVGDYSIILDSNDEAVCIIKVTKVSLIPFNEITEKQARLEGEGDLSLQYWRNTHINFFQSEVKEYGLEFNLDDMIVFEEFEVVYQ